LYHRHENARRERRQALAERTEEIEILGPGRLRNKPKVGERGELSSARGLSSLDGQCRVRIDVLITVSRARTRVGVKDIAPEVIEFPTEKNSDYILAARSEK